jgi:hypothetical protein
LENDANLDLLDHSPLGPSAAAIWINCTASVRLQKGLPDSESSFAAEGTAAHMLSEWARNENETADKWLGQKIEFPKRTGSDELWSFEVTQEMVDGVNEFLDDVSAYPPHGRPGVELYEARVHYPSFVPGGFGTADDIRIWTEVDDTGVCRITDLKFGKGVSVEVLENTQLKMYALGVLEEFGHLYEIDKFILSISQSRIQNSGSWEITTADLLKWAEEVVRPAAQEALGDAPKVKAGEHCRWCRARFTCKARAAHVLNLIHFDQLDVMKDRMLLDPMEIAELLPHLGEIKSFANDIHDKAEELVLARQKVGDWKMVAGRRFRKWDDPTAVEKTLARLKYGADKRYKPRELISPAEAEKLLGKKHKMLGAPGTKGGHVVWSDGAPKLAPGSDPRPSIIQEIEFEDLTSESSAGSTNERAGVIQFEDLT